MDAKIKARTDAKAIGENSFAETVDYNFAATKIETGDYEGAYEYFSKLSEPSAQSLHKLAICCEKLGKKEEASAAIEKEKSAKSDYEKLCTIISETPDSCVFVLSFDALEISVKKNKKFDTLMKNAEKNNGVAVLLDHRTVPELVKMLTNGAQKRGCRFDSSAAKYLVEVVGVDINTLKSYRNEF